VLTSVGYPDPEECAKMCSTLDVDLEVDILDMGCGTGLVGEHLKKLGFTNITGIDASPEMLEKARQKDAYKALDECFLGQPDLFPREYLSKFSVITASGVLAEGHLSNKFFDEMILALKPQGYAIFTTREEYMTKYKYEEKINELKDSSQWKLVKQVDFERYNEGPVGRFKPTTVTVYAYQKE
jgi:predicted TPR repeat methyltransferase